jgi:hypothetical protein
MRGSLAGLAWAARRALATPMNGLRLEANVAPLPAHLPPVPDDVLYPERLRHALRWWRAILPQGDAALRLIEEGLVLPINGHRQAKPRSPIIPGSGITESEIAAEILRLEGNGTLRRARPGERIFCCNIFAKRKPSGAIRIIYNATPVNAELSEPPPLALRDLRDARELLKNCSIAAAADLTDAFFMVPVAAQSQHLLGFRFRLIRYVYQVMPFGLSWAPFILQSLTNRLLQAAALRTAAGSTYVDDTLFGGTSTRNVAGAQKRYVRTARALGFLIKREKLQPPSTKVTFLGVDIDLTARTIALTERRKKNLHRVAAVLHQQLRRRGKMSTLRKTARTLAGHLASAAALTSANLAALKPIQMLRERSTPSRRRNAAYTAAKLMTAELPPLPLVWEPSSVLYTDASDHHWGAVFLHHGRETKLSGAYPPHMAAAHINAKELWTVLAVVRRLALHDHAVQLMLDNRSALYAVRSGARAPALQKLALLLNGHCSKNRVMILPTWIPTALNIADAPSRQQASGARPPDAAAPALYATFREVSRLAFVAPTWVPPSIKILLRSDADRNRLKKLGW